MDFDESYEILEGIADAWINGGPTRLTAGGESRQDLQEAPRT